MYYTLINEALMLTPFFCQVKAGKGSPLAEHRNITGSPEDISTKDEGCIKIVGTAG